jgi:hypothetical protein
MSWLSDLLGKVVKTSTETLPDRKIVRFLGDGVAVTDNPAEGSTDVAIGGGGGSGSSFNVSDFDTWAEFYTEASTAAAPVTVYFPEDYTIPAGTYNVQGWTFLGVYDVDSGTPIELEIDEDVVFNTTHITARNLVMFQKSTAADAVMLTATAQYTTIVLDNATLRSDSAACCFVQLGAGGFLNFRMSGTSELDSRVAEVPAAQTGSIFVYTDGGSIGEAAFLSDVTSTAVAYIISGTPFGTYYETQLSPLAVFHLYPGSAQADLDMGSHKMVGLAAPGDDDTAAANRLYVNGPAATAAALADDDKVGFKDISDTSEGSDGTRKWFTFTNLWTWFLTKLGTLATVSTSSATLSTESVTRVTYAGGTCALSLPASTTTWPVGVTRRVVKENTSANGITLAPDSGGTIQGLGTNVAMTLPGSTRPAATTYADQWWDVTREATSTWRVQGGAVRYDSSGNVDLGAGNLATSGTVDGRDVSTDGGILDTLKVGDASAGIVATAKTSNFSVGASETYLRLDTSSGAIAATAPSPAVAGRRFTLKKISTDANPVTLVQNASEQIEGVAATFTCPGSTFANKPSYTFESNGTNWDMV